MPLQRAEGPVYVPYSKRDPSQIKKPEVRTKSALQQNVQQKDSPQNATDPSTDPKKASSKEVKRAKHADAKQLGAKKKKPGEEGICDVFFDTFNCLRWFKATAKRI